MLAHPSDEHSYPLPGVIEIKGEISLHFSGAAKCTMSSCPTTQYKSMRISEWWTNVRKIHTCSPLLNLFPSTFCRMQDNHLLEHSCVFVHATVTIIARRCIALLCWSCTGRAGQAAPHFRFWSFYQIPGFVSLTQWNVVSVKARGLSPATPAGVGSPLCHKMPIVRESCFHCHCSATLPIILNRSTELLHLQGMAAACCGGTWMQVDQSIPGPCSSCVHMAEWVLLVEQLWGLGRSNSLAGKHAWAAYGLLLSFVRAQWMAEVRHEPYWRTQELTPPLQAWRGGFSL